jgi:uncharacterized circularly permuted ATP-grasp superfamily protein/uncharacterized alpha-E superfamily protein
LRDVPLSLLQATRYDEMVDAQGAPRAHWRTLVERLGSMDATAARRGIELTRRLIVDNGVTYNVYADPKGTDRPWDLDPLPLPITSDEWRAIEAGLVQRATLLDRLLQDLYGPQRLLAEGLAPTELAFGHPNFLWPCVGVTPRGGRWLHVYAADLARAPDGRWWVLGDRAQAPSGAGYALENREILEQVLPDAYRELRVRRVRDVFDGLRERVLGTVDEADSPLAVILTPGPFNETYFEHAFLARQLGWPLVEGSDLTVRDTTVYLKTLGGLRRVHAILRRLDDDYCDPLELRSDSALGVAGLLAVVRAGRVTLANALGSGVLESAGWLGFMPGLCTRLLGESLRLPSVATWWCGERPALAHVLANLDRLVIKPAYPNQRFEPVFGHQLDAAARERLVARLKARPYAFVAQEYVALSQAPMWRSAPSAPFERRALTVRVYAIATAEGYRVMPGGLARVAQECRLDVVSTQRGGGSKDIWVLGDDAPATGTTAAPRHGIAVARPDELPSRLVENLYWLGRYAVRCDDKARLLRSTLGLRVDASAFGHALALSRARGAVAADTDPAAALRDADDPLGLVADLRRLARSASQVRSHLSERYWRTVVGVQRQMQQSAASSENPREALERLLVALAAMRGFASEDMTRDEGWRLMRLGRRIEKLQSIATLLALQLEAKSATRPRELEWLLETCDSVVAYRARFTAAPQLRWVLRLLLLEERHPASVCFQMAAIGTDLAQLDDALGAGPQSLLHEALPTPLDAQLDTLDCDDDAAAGARAALAGRLHGLAGAAGALSDALSRRYFTHTEFLLQAIAT